VLLLAGCAAIASMLEGDPEGEPAEVGAEAAGALPAVGGFLYEPGVVHEFALDLPDESVAALAADPRTPVPATFAWQGETYAVSVHLKGAASFRDLTGKAAFKVDFHEYDPEATFHGVRRLTLNNMVQDGSMLREAGAYAFFAAMGLPAPRHGYARVTVGGEPYGLYGIVETPDEQFLDRFESDEGNLYAGGYGGDVSRGNAENFELEEAGDAGEPWVDLEALCEAMDEPADLWGALGEHFDRDALLGLWAVEIVSGQTDGYLRWANNFLLYDDVGAGRWVMIPWGTDSALDGDLTGEWRGDLADACRSDATCLDALRARVNDALAVWAEADIPGFLDDTAALLHDDCEADVRTEIPCRYTQDEVLDFAHGRADAVRWGREVDLEEPVEPVAF
jgi:spore coat protein CotH